MMLTQWLVWLSNLLPFRLSFLPRLIKFGFSHKPWTHFCRCLLSLWNSAVCLLQCRWTINGGRKITATYWTCKIQHTAWNLNKTSNAVHGSFTLCRLFIAYILPLDWPLSGYHFIFKLKISQMIRSMKPLINSVLHFRFWGVWVSLSNGIVNASSAHWYFHLFVIIARHTQYTLFDFAADISLSLLRRTFTGMDADSDRRRKQSWTHFRWHQPGKSLSRSTPL